MKEDYFRQRNLERISTLHKALRWSAIGACHEGFEGYTLGGLAAELKGRIALEVMYKMTDPPPPIVVSKEALEKMNIKMPDQVDPRRN